MQTIIVILIVAVAAFFIGRKVFAFFRAMTKPGKGGSCCSCGCGGEKKDETQNRSPKTVFIPVSALTKKH